jgi:dTDP-4-dehydrorhamnose reductase
MLKLAEDRDEVNVVADQIGCPTFTGHLAPALVQIAEQRLTGILHVAGGGQCSWQEFAQAAFEEAGTGTTANPVATAEFPRPAPRPPWSVLRSTRRDAPVLPYWRHGLTDYLNSEVLQ